MRVAVIYVETSLNTAFYSMERTMHGYVTTEFSTGLPCLVLVLLDTKTGL